MVRLVFGGLHPGKGETVASAGIGKEATVRVLVRGLLGGAPKSTMGEELQRQCVAVLKHKIAREVPRIREDFAAESKEESEYVTNNRHSSLTKENAPRTSMNHALWRCDKGHVWTRTIQARVRPGAPGCPNCSSLSGALQLQCVAVLKHDEADNVPAVSGNLVAGSKEEREYVDDNKHPSLTVANATASSPWCALWRCNEGHVLTATIKLRVKDNGCLECKNIRAAKMGEELQRQ
eukprot:CAMPEP_0173432084 /NCGR_PEP_ID=MMETSP1357-20121228/10009_1 /TAXON_ID=77926 /ORGANISM="Hemiselmis rufescens, Strain PCC563" /LENGTH=234 /DNA_ID=CAMNT_0014396639 /DNA_START=18 /DNA_END=719 /DNA_ORIENTATION=+